MRVKELPNHCPEPRTQRPRALQLGAAILSKREGRVKTTCERGARGRRGWAGSRNHVRWGRGLGRVTWGGARRVRLRRPVAAAGAVAFGGDSVSVLGSQSGAGKCRFINALTFSRL